MEENMLRTNSQLVVSKVKGEAQLKDSHLYKYIVLVKDKLCLFKEIRDLICAKEEKHKKRSFIQAGKYKGDTH